MKLFLFRPVRHSSGGRRRKGRSDPGIRHDSPHRGDISGRDGCTPVHTRIIREDASSEKERRIRGDGLLARHGTDQYLRPGSFVCLFRE